MTTNSWNDKQIAKEYAELEFNNTYHIAYRDLPEIISKHVSGNKALDFGCGTGRSTRFLEKLGFDVIGIDIAENMLSQAREIDPKGHYELVTNNNYTHLGTGLFDFIQSIFTFDNIFGLETRQNILKNLKELLKPEGTMICLDANPLLYHNESASFSTKDFPENKTAKTGDTVKVVMNDLEDKTPISDVYWTEEDYLKLFKNVGFSIKEIYRPLGKPDEPFEWKMETTIPPWLIFVLN
ncbi:MAG: class I SAM-dependent methyltransferase [bacterium]